MSDILDRARQAQHDAAHVTYMQIRLDFLQDLIWEIERLRAEVARAAHPATTSIKQIRGRVEGAQG